MSDDEPSELSQRSRSRHSERAEAARTDPGTGMEAETVSPDSHDRLAELAPVLRTLPPGTQVCIIAEGDGLLLLNINAAIELVRGRTPTIVVDVARQAKLIQPRGAASSEDTARIDPDHAATVDLSYPIMILESRAEMDGSPGRVIDGWHRIYRASQLGFYELPAIVLTPEDEALIRIDPDVRRIEA